jgi:hypothetical protein
MPQLAGLQLVVLLALLAQLVVRQLLQVEQQVVQAHSQVLQLEQRAVQVHSQVPLVELQQVQNSSLVQILVLGESPLLMHQQQVLKLRELLQLLNLLLLVSMF